MKVYILIRGEDYEGGAILGVYSSQVAADAAYEAELKARPLSSVDWLDVEAWDVKDAA